MVVQDLYKKLESTNSSSQHLVMAQLFHEVFGRKVRNKEWGHLRKLMKLYGVDIVFWSILDSCNIDASGNPLVYVAKVCSGKTKTISEKTIIIDTKTQELLTELRNYKAPDWEAILNAED